VSLADELEKTWGKKKVPEKKKKKEKPIEPEKEPQEFDDLYEESAKAKLEQEVLKAEQLKYKNERERLKLMQEARELIKFDMAEFLFFGFMEKTNFEILRLLRKIEPVIKDLCNENQPMELINRLTHDLEAIIKDIKRQQQETVKNWKEESND